MPAETALVEKPKRVWSLAEAEERTKRKELRLRKREAHLKNLVQEITIASVEDVKLKEYVGLSVEQLRAKGLTDQQIYKVEQWSQPKKAIAFALEASNQHVTAILRREGEKPSVKINVENATIFLPEKREETVAPVFIDVNPDGDR
jgi:hypothetical protein